MPKARLSTGRRERAVECVLDGFASGGRLLPGHEAVPENQSLPWNVRNLSEGPVGTEPEPDAEAVSDGVPDLPEDMGLSG